MPAPSPATSAECPSVAETVSEVAAFSVMGSAPKFIATLSVEDEHDWQVQEPDVEVRLIHSGEPCLIPVNNPYIQAATRALHEVWGKDTVFIRSGGSIPIVGDFARHLGLPSVMMGFGLPDDNLHAPNEKFNLKNFALGIESLIRFFEETGS